jgi:hypothetical protein
MASEAPLSAEDRALLARVAARAVDLHLEVPALLALESLRPLSLVASQAMLFFEPIAQALLRLADYRRFAHLVERREALEALAALIEARASEVRAARHGTGVRKGPSAPRRERGRNP